MASCPRNPQYAGDSTCDDGGDGSEYSDCDWGTDCADCGTRCFSPPVAPPSYSPPPLTVLELTFTIDATIESFDTAQQAEMAQKLRDQLSCSLPACSLELTPESASLLITVTVTMHETNNAVVSGVVASANGLAALNATELSTLIGVTVEQGVTMIVPPALPPPFNLSASPSSPPPAPSPRSPPRSPLASTIVQGGIDNLESGGSGSAVDPVTWIGAAVGAGVIAACLVTAWWVRNRRRGTASREPKASEPQQLPDPLTSAGLEQLPEQDEDLYRIDLGPNGPTVLVRPTIAASPVRPTAAASPAFVRPTGGSPNRLANLVAPGAQEAEDEGTVTITVGAQEAEDEGTIHFGAQEAEVEGTLHFGAQEAEDEGTVAVGGGEAEDEGTVAFGGQVVEDEGMAPSAVPFEFDETATGLKLKRKRTEDGEVVVRVHSVVAGGQAERHGIEPDWVLTRIEDAPVADLDEDELMEEIARRPATFWFTPAADDKKAIEPQDSSVPVSPPHDMALNYSSVPVSLAPDMALNYSVIQVELTHRPAPELVEAPAPEDEGEEVSAPEEHAQNVATPQYRQPRMLRRKVDSPPPSPYRPPPAAPLPAIDAELAALAATEAETPTLSAAHATYRAPTPLAFEFDETATGLKLKRKRTEDGEVVVRVHSVVEGGQAERHGIRSDWVFTRIEDAPVADLDEAGLMREVANRPATFWFTPVTSTQDVQLAEAPPPHEEAEEGRRTPPAVRRARNAPRTPGFDVDTEVRAQHDDEEDRRDLGI